MGQVLKWCRRSVLTILAPVDPGRNTRSAVGEGEQTIMPKQRQIPEDIKQKALSMLETDNIDTVAATLRIRKAALLKMIKDEAVDIEPSAAASMDDATTEDAATSSDAATPIAVTAPEDAAEEEKKDRKVPITLPNSKLQPSP